MGPTNIITHPNYHLTLIPLTLHGSCEGGLGIWKVISGFGTWGFRRSDGNAPVLVAESGRWKGGLEIWGGQRERERERNMLAWKCHGVLELLWVKEALALDLDCWVMKISIYFVPHGFQGNTHARTRAHVIICLNYSEVFTKTEKHGPYCLFPLRKKGIRKVKRIQEPHVCVSFQVERKDSRKMVTHLWWDVLPWVKYDKYWLVLMLLLKRIVVEIWFYSHEKKGVIRNAKY